MQQEGGEIYGNIIIDDDFELTGVIVGSVTVVSGGSFSLTGTITGDLTLRSGSACVVNGTVGGSIFNRGGNLKLFGIVKGNLRRDAGMTYIDKGARIFGQLIDHNFK